MVRDNFTFIGSNDAVCRKEKPYHKVLCLFSFLFGSFRLANVTENYSRKTEITIKTVEDEQTISIDCAYKVVVASMYVIDLCQLCGDIYRKQYKQCLQ